MIDQVLRGLLNKAVAKAIAYKNVGKDKEAQEWGEDVVRLMQQAGIIK